MKLSESTLRTFLSIIFAIGVGLIPLCRSALEVRHIGAVGVLRRSVQTARTGTTIELYGLEPDGGRKLARMPGQFAASFPEDKSLSDTSSVHGGFLARDDAVEVCGRRPQDPRRGSERPPVETERPHRPIVSYGPVPLPRRKAASRSGTPPRICITPFMSAGLEALTTPSCPQAISPLVLTARSRARSAPCAEIALIARSDPLRPVVSAYTRIPGSDVLDITVEQIAANVEVVDLIRHSIRSSHVRSTSAG